MAGLSGDEWSRVKPILQQIALNIPQPEDVRPDAFFNKPPEWAVWEEMGMHGERCGGCGSWCEVVRPGKTQCPTCGDNPTVALAIRANNVLLELGELGEQHAGK